MSSKEWLTHSMMDLARKMVGWLLQLLGRLAIARCQQSWLIIMKTKYYLQTNLINLPCLRLTTSINQRMWSIMHLAKLTATVHHYLVARWQVDLK